MDRAEAAVLTVLVVLAILAWSRSSYHGGKRHGGYRRHFCPAPHNIGVYDEPHTGYPFYEGRGATWWDADRRCTSSCMQSPCTVWCR